VTHFQSVRLAVAALGSALVLTACGGAGSSVQPLALNGAVPALQARSSATTSSWGRWHHGFGFGHGWRNLNLTGTQQTQLHQLMAQFRQAHPRGSTPDPQAREQLHQQMLAILTPQQQTQLQAEGARFHGGPMANLNLSDQQRSQIRQLMMQFRQSHPRGSAPDMPAREQLHQQILSVLTPEQRTQLEQERQQWQATRG
jgi:Spy/CpxP family protein refolding chaperone